MFNGTVYIFSLYLIGKLSGKLMNRRDGISVALELMTLSVLKSWEYQMIFPREGGGREAHTNCVIRHKFSIFTWRGIVRTSPVLVFLSLCQ